MSVKRISEDERFEAAMQASGNERRNRPLSLVWLGGALLAASVLTLIAGWWSKRSAESHYFSRADDSFRVQRMVQEWNELEQKQSTGAQAGAHEPNLRISTTLEELATSAGIKNKPLAPKINPRNIPGGKEMTYVYNDVRDESLQTLIDWVRLATEQIPGLELVEIPELKSDAAGWRMRVIFKRWERAE